MHNELLHIGPLTVYGYGFMIAMGVLAAWFVAEQRARKLKLACEHIFYLVVWCAIGGFTSAKILFWITNWREFLQNPRQIIGSDGFVVYGGIIGGILVGWLYCRIKKLKFLEYFDLMMPSIALAQGFGRIGCFLAGCCYGKETSGPLAVTFTNSDFAPNNVALIPTQIYSGFLDFAHFLLLLYVAKHKKADGQVDLSHVDFSYNKDVELIKNLNLKVEPGKRVAIVGPTGCGKSTVINLLMRFYDVDAGAISVDGHDIRQVTRESLRDNYGMVLQETWLKTGTIKENIAYGRPDATDEEIIEAAKQSHAHSFIKRLSEGYDTMISEDGGGLSQGQKQLLCITRVMLDLPPMLILDEATSSIDTRTEIRIQRAFAKMMKGRTSFVVAHRLSTIKESDIILVMKDGHIIEQGNHESLLAQKGFYYTLYNSQFAH